MTKTLYINEEKDYEELLNRYYIHPEDYQVGSGYSKDWLYGYVACLFASMIIDEKKRLKLNDFIAKLKEKERK